MAWSEQTLSEQTQPHRFHPMHVGRLTTPFIVAGALVAINPASAQVAPPPAAQPAAPAAEKTIELSPFVVTAEGDDTWLATSTLAGSRLNTPLRDTGASISVLTS